METVRGGELGSPPSDLRIALLVSSLVLWSVASVSIGLVAPITWAYDCNPSATDCAADAARHQMGQTVQGIIVGTVLLIAGWAIARVICAVGVDRQAKLRSTKDRATGKP